MIFKSKSTIIPELNLILCKDVSLDEARVLANNSKKAKIPIPECQRTAKIFNSTKAFYTQFNNTYYLILVYTDHANVIPIPFKPLEMVWECYRHDIEKDWKWWSMGWGLPMMLESLVRDFNCNELEITNDMIIGHNKKHLQFILSLETPKKFPKIYVDPELQYAKKLIVHEVVAKNDTVNKQTEEPAKKRTRKTK